MGLNARFAKGRDFNLAKNAADEVEWFGRLSDSKRDAHYLLVNQPLSRRKPRSVTTTEVFLFSYQLLFLLRIRLKRNFRPSSPLKKDHSTKCICETRG